ncbi:hypothetical protein UPYG_G00066820 [Umbra pygmaea]|uniref:Uncharacterized protein n=1 Tax=Umbra pygmaea TaxID=75934 RepID=A0ABD0XAM6_UMBPY
MYESSNSRMKRRTYDDDLQNANVTMRKGARNRGENDGRGYGISVPRFLVPLPLMKIVLQTPEEQTAQNSARPHNDRNHRFSYEEDYDQDQSVKQLCISGGAAPHFDMEISGDRHDPNIHPLGEHKVDLKSTGFQRFLTVLNKGVDVRKLSTFIHEVNELSPVREGPSKTINKRNRKVATARSSGDFPEARSGIEGGLRFQGETSVGVPLGQLQSLLETIGLDIGLEELGRLTDRTQERLYGMKGEPESKLSIKHPRSPTTSDSSSPFPLTKQHPQMTFDYGHSSTKEWDKDGDWDQSKKERDRRNNSRDRESSERDWEESERDRARIKDRDRERDRHYAPIYHAPLSIPTWVFTLPQHPTVFLL